MAEEVPAGVANPPFTVTDTDKRGIIVVVSVVLLSFLLVSFLTRIWVRLRVSGPWSYDDTTLTVATIFGIGQSIAVFLEVHQGFGLSGDVLSSQSIANVGAADYASSILYLIAACLSKCSVVALIMRLTSNRSHKLVGWVNIGAAIFWGFSSILLITIRCSPAGRFSDLALQCNGLLARWTYICALDIATEASIFAMSIYLVANLQMSVRIKATVVLAFAIRLPVIAASATRLHYLHRQVYSANPTLDGYLAGVWTQVQVSYSLIATAAACLGPFIRPFGKPYMTETTYDSRKRSYAPEYHLSKMTANKSGGSSNSRSRRSGTHIYPGHVPQEPARYEPPTKTAGEQTASGALRASRQSLDSHESQRMIITKGVEWTVEYDGREDGDGGARRMGSDEGSSIRA